MGNLGKAKVSVKIGGAMPSMGSALWYNTNDVSAKDLTTGYEGAAKEVDFIADPMSGGQMVVPLRRWRQVANYVKDAPSSANVASPRIIWTVLTKTATDTLDGCVGSDYIAKLITNTSLEILSPLAVAALTTGSTSYAGPRWDVPRGMKIVPQVDLSSPGSTAPAGSPPTPTPSTADDFSTAYIAQEAVCQDIWWSIETESLKAASATATGINQIKIGTPFYLDVMLKQPYSSKQTTFFAVRIGDLGSSTSATSTTSENIDLVFVYGQKGKLYDWGMMVTPPAASGGTAGSPEPVTATLPGELTWGDTINRIGFLPLAGKLCISVNGSDFIYTRVDQTPASTPPAGGAATPAAPKGAIPIYMSPDKIRVIGSNSQAVIGLESMYFPESATVHTSMTLGVDPTTGLADKELHGSTSGEAAAAADASISLFHMPDAEHSSSGTGGAAPTYKHILGAFARISHEGGAAIPLVSDNTSDVWGQAAKDRTHGELFVEKADNVITGGHPGAPVGKHYTIRFLTDKSAFGEFGGSTATPTWWPILPPIFYRARGVNTVTSALPAATAAVDVSDAVMEISESFTSPDRYHITHSMDITLYNENGIYDALGENSSPVQIGLSWVTGSGSASSTKIFTGVTLNSSSVLAAGKETISIHCEDYMHLLEVTLIINSPYFDGMDGFSVVRDLSAKANVMVVDDTGYGPGERFFLPSGYSFLEPAKRYDPKSSVKESILDVCSSGCKVVYFDGDGVMHYQQIQGGISFATAGSVTSVRNYFSDPAVSPSDKQTLLDEKRTETKLNSTTNRIFIKSVDRTTRAIIMASSEAPASGPNSNRLAYHKTTYASLPSLGSLDAVNAQMERWKPRFWKPIRGISIKTADDTPIIPMSFISVDGKKYRVMGVNRTLSVADNSITTSITGEWMGDQ